MRILITGANGQLGYELEQTAPKGIELITVDVDTLDITSAEAVTTFFSTYQPNAVINAAAYTAVDRAETEQAAAYAVNASGAQLLAQACAAVNIPMVQVSTDFIFDGTQSTPYQVNDTANPLSVYGASKLQGEQAVAEILGNKACIIRTAWVYSAHGNNFVKTMLRLMAEKEQLSVVADQIGTPTWARTLATGCWKALKRLSDEALQRSSGETLQRLSDEGTNVESLNDSTLKRLDTATPQLCNIYHLTDAGIASWYDFAAAIQEEALALGMLNKAIPVLPIPTTAYPTPAKRPAFSVLDKTETYAALNITPQHWRDSLRLMLRSMLNVETFKRSSV